LCRPIRRKVGSKLPSRVRVRGKCFGGSAFDSSSGGNGHNPRMKIDKLTRESFAEFGDVISMEGAHHFPINNGTTERYHDLARIDVGENFGRPLVSIFRGQPRQFPFAVTTMERHPLGSQAFIPLSGTPYLIVVAPRGAFDASALRGFLSSSGQGVNYGKGVWHHALIALDVVSDFIVIDRGGPGSNCDEMQVTDPVTISQDDVASDGLRLAVGR
jgi:ureidoglycolate lyase